MIRHLTFSIPETPGAVTHYFSLADFCQYLYLNKILSGDEANDLRWAIQKRVIKRMLDAFNGEERHSFEEPLILGPQDWFLVWSNWSAWVIRPLLPKIVVGNANIQNILLEIDNCERRVTSAFYKATFRPVTLELISTHIKYLFRFTDNRDATLRVELWDGRKLLAGYTVPHTDHDLQVNVLDRFETPSLEIPVSLNEVSSETQQHINNALRKLEKEHPELMQKAKY